MRKSLAILLLLVFGLSCAAPLFALSSGSDASVPVCCRRNGAHHCTGNMPGSERMSEQSTQVHHVAEKCPCCPTVAPVLQTNLFTATQGTGVTAVRVSVSALLPLRDAQCATVVSRSNPKRGPPAANS